MLIDTNCQLKSFEASVEPFNYWERIMRKILKKIYIRFKKFKRKIEKLVHEIFNGRTIQLKNNQESSIEILSLKPGEKIRIKSYDQIKRTLDNNGKYQGLAFTPAQIKYCGGTYIVLKRLEKAFDERRWKLFKVKNTVLLEGVVCDGKGGIEKAWDGCDRHCLLWWKEIWLERIK